MNGLACCDVFYSLSEGCTRAFRDGRKKMRDI